MRYSLTAAFLLASVLSCAWVRGATYPEPSIYPIAWELKFDHSIPKRIVVHVPGSNAPVAYWYMTYTVTNDTDSEQVFLPDFEMVTSAGQIIHGDRHIPPQVFDRIKAQEKNKLLEPPTKISGEIRLGEAEARDGVAIWPEPMPRMGSFSIFVNGLSGEFIQLKDKDGAPVMVKDEQGKDVEPVILRKTLQLNYHVNGDEVYPGEDLVNSGQGRTGANAEVWVMR